MSDAAEAVDSEELDLYELAFNEFEEEPKAKEPEAETPPAEEPPEVEPKAEEPPPEEEPPEAPPEEAPPEAPKAKTEEEIRAELAAEAKAKEEQEQADEQARKDQEEREAAAKPDSDESALLEEVGKDFPDVSKALDIQKRILTAEFNNTLDAKLKEFKKELAPALAATQTVVQNSHTTAITDKHKDAFEIIPQVEEWIAKQPQFLQAAYNETLDSGTAENVVALLDTFKAATAPPETGGETAEEKTAREAKEAQEAEAKRKKLESQEGIRTKQSARTAGVDENDFEGAFNAAASE